MFDIAQLLAMRREGIWIGVLALWDGFGLALASHPWMWLIVVLFLLRAGWKGIVKLLRFVGGAYAGRARD